jgi:hypothetical protein
MASTASHPLVCIELVELVTDYFEDRLSLEDRLRFDEHIAGCEPCVRYIEQLAVTVELSGQLRPRDLDPAMRDALVEAFRGWRRGH